MRIKKMMQGLTCIVAAMFMLTTMAWTNEDLSEENSSTFEINMDVEQMSEEHLEFMERIMYGTDGIANDEVKAVATLDNGLTLYVTVDDVVNEMARAAQTQTRNFTFYTKNLLGKEVDAFKVSMTCSWDENGNYSKISNLKGSWTIYDSSFSLSWDTSNFYVANLYHSMGLKIIHNFSSALYIFYAQVDTLNTPVSCYLGYGAW